MSCCVAQGFFFEKVARKSSMFGKSQIQLFLSGLMTGIFLLSSFHFFFPLKNNKLQIKNSSNIFLLSIKINFKNEEGKQFFIEM